MRIDGIRSRNQAFFVLILVLIAIFFVSCRNGRNESPVLPPPTSPLSRPYIGFGVINASYTRINTEPGEGADSSGVLRRGTVVLIRERRQMRIGAGGRMESWLLVEETSSGWLRESFVDVFDNEPQARTASQTMIR